MRDEVLADKEFADRIKYKYSIKNVTGLNIRPFIAYSDPFDIIAHLLVGSEGTLAFLSEVTMKTAPIYPYRASALIYFNDIREAATAVVAMKRGGRIFYLGAGTSGRLGVLDASEIPPTFGMPPTLVIGLIAGGDTALRNPVENAEDDLERGWQELLEHHIDTKDTVVGIAASGTTPYVIGALHSAREHDNRILDRFSTHYHLQ